MFGGKKDRIVRTGYGATRIGPYGAIETILTDQVKEVAGGAGHTVAEGVRILNERAAALSKEGITVTEGTTLIDPNGVEKARVKAKQTELSVLRGEDGESEE